MAVKSSRKYFCYFRETNIIIIKSLIFRFHNQNFKLSLMVPCWSKSNISYMCFTPRSKTLIDVIITNNRDTVIHAETSLSIADHHAVSCTINLRKQRMAPFQIYGRNYANYWPENFQIKLMQLSNQLKLMYETNSVNTQVQIILTDNFLLALNACAQFEVKLIKRPLVIWFLLSI